MEGIMIGIEYIVDEEGHQKAAVIDLGIFGDIWEDIHDILVVESRKNEPRIEWDEFKEKVGA